MDRFPAKSTDLHEDASMLELYPLKVIYYMMLSKWNYLSVLKHPHDDIHQLVEVDDAGNWIFVYELAPPNDIHRLQRICNADFTLQLAEGLKQM
jgi:hypothetical protein